MVSGLRVNYGKSVIIPLTPGALDSTMGMLERTSTNWTRMQVAYRAKYLGFQLGPHRGTSTWDKPCQKFQERVDMWRDRDIGMSWTTRAHNTFALPVLTYVAQLDTPPDWVIEADTEGIDPIG